MFHLLVDMVRAAEQSWSSAQIFFPSLGDLPIGAPGRSYGQSDSASMQAGIDIV